jgi:hypothetical protein
MKRKSISLMILTLLLAALLASTALAAGGVDKKLLKQVRAANDAYRKPAAAMQAGYGLVPGLDHCFDNPGVGAMGYHYINAGLLDTALDPLRPEAMVYHTAKDGRLKLGAIEYIVPAAAWDAEGHAGPPEVLGRRLHLNSALGVYVLHAWLWKPNPTGVFQDWNPQVSCP